MPARRTTNIKRRPRTTSKKGSHQLLDVKMRADTVRRQRTRKVHKVLFNTIIGLFLLVGLYFGGQVLLEKFFFKNPDYNVQHLNASLDDIITQEEMQEKTGFRKGVNIFSLDLSGAERTLSELPDVKKARVERILPNTVRVILERRIPVLRLATASNETFVAGQSFVVDKVGVVMRPVALNATLLQLPFIEGVDFSKAQLGQPLKEERLDFALHLLDAFNNTGGVPVEPRSIDLSRGYCAVVTDANNAHFTFGEDHIPEQMGRLQKLLAYCDQTERNIQSANLILEHNTPVIFRPNSEAASLATRTKNKK